ncbi:type II toxin-antitoxin system prevent-host-death family antitoxin [Neisseria animalis]|uniref:Antitoxin n=1 Tax=Neisseria animalis TaxID=492 RepID=A0A5P3MRG0_NEIAN|nr:type II toxin-antitoxin system prevent-host-death family antitoxin [Neisseria animalis]QEY24118.1 type II toxin-antitoxin system Phd/YefM family antitoxin [Neisseria animalis]ROW32686.1 type II toxin-antitoxin system Phd/YefM family antitoxin [Neisseria animalis]VEE06324.1 putative prevent-host-death protein [Neisseria animalis]
MQTFSSREFNQRTSQAQKAAHTAPVFITNRGKPDLVLLSHTEYLRLTGKKQTALDVLNSIESDAADIELEIPPRSPAQRRTVEFE